MIFYEFEDSKSRAVIPRLFPFLLFPFFAFLRRRRAECPIDRLVTLLHKDGLVGIVGVGKREKARIYV